MQETNTPHIEDNQSAVSTATQRSGLAAKVKKAFAVIAIVIVALMLIVGTLVGILHIKSVQTFIVGKVADAIFDKDTFEVTDIVIKKSGFSEQIKSSENIVPMELVNVLL